jgi:DIM1 family U5 snRNP protein
MKMDETLYSVAEKVQNFAVIYLVDITQVPDFNKVRATLRVSRPLELL